MLASIVTNGVSQQEIISKAFRLLIPQIESTLKLGDQNKILNLLESLQLICYLELNRENK